MTGGNLAGDVPWAEDFVTAMQDNDRVIRAIQYSLSESPAEADFMKHKKKALAHSQFVSMFGKKTFKRNFDDEVPMEEQEFVNWMTAKGWPEHGARTEWLKMCKSCEVADHNGYKGGKRLWILKNPKRQSGQEDFNQTMEKSCSDVMKNAKAKTVDAIREYAARAAVNPDHEFFSGRSSTAAGPKTDREMILGDEEGEPPSDGEEGEDEEGREDLEAVSENAPHGLAESGVAPSSIATPAFGSATKTMAQEVQKIEEHGRLQAAVR